MIRITAALVSAMVAVMAGDTALAQTRRTGTRGGPAGDAAGAVIVGRVVSPATNSPVREALVSAVADRAGAPVTATTDESGAYRLVLPFAGDWRVTASKGGYITWQFGQRRPFQVPPPIALTRGQQFNADIPLTRGGAITGRLYDASGVPVAAAQVRAYRASIDRGARRLKPVGVADFSDDTGAYRVYGLPPGDYYVGASLRVAPLESIVETTYAPTYFPGTGNLAEAQRIRVGLGSEVSATFPLLAVRPSRVSGVVLAASGGAADAFLQLVSESAELGAPISVGGATRADGTFTLPDVAPGRYLLKATLRGDGPDESGAVPVDVFGEDLSGITVVTGPPASLRVTIARDAGVSRALPRDLTVVAASSREGGTVLGSGEGPTFEIAALSEPFRLFFEGLPEGWALTEMSVNGATALDAPIELAPGQRAVARMVLTDRVTQLEGNVTPLDSTGARSVVVFPEDPAKWTYRSRHVRTAETDSLGTFRIVGLPPGERYLALATDYLEDGEHLDPDFLGAVRGLAVPFSLKEGERMALELRVVER